jgi:RNA polymerase subunit RPABC4/transcription elongation factor Spt4
MFCENCGAKLDSDSKFCRTCGAPAETAESSTKYCPFCKNVIEMNSITCSHCGRTLVEKVYSHSESARPSRDTDKKSGGPTTGASSQMPPRDTAPCQGCGMILPTKHVRLSQNIGMLFRRQSRTIDANLCKTCIDKYFSRFTLTTFILGWWGMISFFVTIGYLFNNIFVFLGSLRMKRSF